MNSGTFSSAEGAGALSEAGFSRESRRCRRSVESFI